MVEQFSVIIALMMLMMGVAASVQRLFPDRYLIEQFVGLEILLALLGGFAPLAIYAAFGLLEHHFLLVLYAFVMAIGFLIGFELPLVLRINSTLVRRLPSNLAVILSLDYVGGFIGALVWTRFLLRELPLTEISFLIAGFNFAIAAVAFAYFAAKRRARSSAWLAPAVAVVALLLAFGFLQNRGWSDVLEQRFYDDPIVHAETTRYQRIVVTRSPQLDDTRVYLNGNLQLSSVDEAVYHEHLVHPAMALAPRRERVLVLGGGDGLALREVLSYPDVADVTLVDLDPRMTELFATHSVLVALNGGAFADARVRELPASGVEPRGRRPVFVEVAPGRPAEVVARVDVLNLDADRFLDGVPGPYDVVLLDFPDPSSLALAKLYSLEFYRKLRRALAPGAHVALQATSAYHSREAFLCILRTVRKAGFAALPYHDDVPSFGSWGWILATPGGSAEASALRERLAALDSLPVETSYLTPEVVRGAFAFGRDRLVAKNAGINTLMRPLLLDLYLHESWLAD